jgi:hypothetical protein
MLGGMERIKTSRWVGVVGNLCLRGKVWGRTLVVLSMASPIVVLSRGGLRVAPNNEHDKISPLTVITWNEAYLGFDLSLLCLEP